jgi:hypothetical protein
MSSSSPALDADDDWDRMAVDVRYEEAQQSRVGL